MPVGHICHRTGRLLPYKSSKYYGQETTVRARRLGSQVNNAARRNAYSAAVGKY